MMCSISKFVLVHQSDVLANIRKQAPPLFNFVRSAEFARVLAKSVRDELWTHGQVQQLSPALVGKLVSEYRAGVSVYELQKIHGVHRNTIAKHLKYHGLILGKRPLSDEEICLARKLHDQRLSLNAIGRAMKRDPKTVKAALLS